MSRELLEVRCLRIASAGEISLKVEEGDRIAIVGPSGSGKTLFCRALAQLDPVEGEVLWRGRAILDDEVPAYRRQVVYLSQRSSLPEGTVGESLRSVLELRAYRGEGLLWNEEQAVSWLGRFGLARAFLGRACRELSGGETQIVALIRALQVGPTVLLLDEPTSALDPDRVLVAEQLVREWKDRALGRAYLWVTHHEAQAPRVSSKTLQVEPGAWRLIQ